MKFVVDGQNRKFSEEFDFELCLFIIYLTLRLLGEAQIYVSFLDSGC